MGSRTPQNCQPQPPATYSTLTRLGIAGSDARSRSAQSAKRWRNRRNAPEMWNTGRARPNGEPPPRTGPTGRSPSNKKVYVCVSEWWAQIAKRKNCKKPRPLFFVVLTKAVMKNYSQFEEVLNWRGEKMCFYYFYLQGFLELPIFLGVFYAFFHIFFSFYVSFCFIFF